MTFKFFWLMIRVMSSEDTKKETTEEMVKGNDSKNELKSYGNQELKNWNNELRPRSLEEVIGQDEVISKLKAYEKAPIETVRPMIFFGKTGLGKSTTAEIWRRELNPVYLDVPQEEEKHAEFVTRVTSLLEHNIAIHKGGDKLILNEGERLKKSSLYDLREPLRKFGGSTKLIITTNSLKTFDEAFLRRFEVLQFHPLSKENLMKVARKVINVKNVKISDDDLKKIIEQSGGSPAFVIDDLQSYNGDSKVPDRVNHEYDPPKIDGFTWKCWGVLSWRVHEKTPSKWVVWCEETGMPGTIDDRHNELLPIPIKYSPSRFPDGIRLVVLHAHGGGMPLPVFFQFLPEFSVLLLQTIDNLLEVLICPLEFLDHLLIPRCLCKKLNHATNEVS